MFSQNLALIKKGLQLPYYFLDLLDRVIGQNLALIKKGLQPGSLLFGLFERNWFRQNLALIKKGLQANRGTGSLETPFVLSAYN